MLSALVVAGCGGSGEDEPASSAKVVAETVPVDTAGATMDDYEVVVDLTYADGALVDVYRPVLEGPWPVIVFAHGMGGSKNDPNIGRGFAPYGAVVYQVDLADEPPFLETVEQVACAVRYARATATDHGGDPNNVALVGFSMGATAGAVVGLTGDDYTAGCVETGASALPDAFIGYEGPYDWAHGEYPGELHLLEESDPEVWAAVDPYAHIGEHPDLVVRLIHGVDGDVSWYDVRPQVSEDFERALSAAGYDVKLTFVEGASHSVGFAGVAQFDEIVEQTLSTTDTN